MEKWDARWEAASGKETKIKLQKLRFGTRIASEGTSIWFVIL
jgi:hypothetical protein